MMSTSVSVWVMPERYNGNTNATIHDAGVTYFIVPGSVDRCGLAESARVADLLLDEREDILVAGDDRTCFQHVTAVDLFDISACFAHENDAGGDVPGLEIAFPETVEPAGGDPGEP